MEEFKSLTKSELYEALERSGKKLPSINSSIVTKQWLLKVCNEEEFCPNYEDVRLRPCPRKPLKNLFIYNILQILDQRKLYLSIDDSHTPDIEWCALVLSTLDPDHQFFQKSYYPSDQEKGRRGGISNKPQISQREANLLEGLPIQIFKKNHQLLNAEVKFQKLSQEESKLQTNHYQSAQKFKIQAQLPQSFNNNSNSMTPQHKNQGLDFIQTNHNSKDSNQSTASKTSTVQNSDDKIQPLFQFSKKQVQNSEIQSNVSMQFSSNERLFQK